jgi:nucleotide-binding universal stress UspA family protein
MAYKDILVYLDDHRGAETRLQLALSLAMQNKAHLVGLYGFALPQAPASLLVAGGHAEDNALLTAYVRDRDTAFDNAAHSEAAFRAAAKRAGLQCEWETRPDRAADLVALVAERARYADLAVLGQADSTHPFFDTLAKLPEAILMGSGRPVLIVPYAGRIDTIGKKVLVAWSGTREVARAVADAMPLLRCAETVTVASIGPPHETDVQDDQPIARCARHLAWHGIRAETAHFTAGDIEAGGLILSRAADFGCDLIVMGGYGHSRARELILGGVTRAVLHHMTMPVLMSH